MNIEELREYCLSQSFTTEDTPFDETTLAFKIGGKIFALTNMITKPTKVNLKCDPERAIELRESYQEVIIPGYHMNKKHWNTIIIDELESNLVMELVTHSYELVYNSLSKAKRLELT